MIESVPGVVLLGDTLRIPGAELFTTTLTPPCCGAPRLKLRDVCNPLPTGVAEVVIAGVETVIGRVAPGSAVNRGWVATMFALPVVNGSTPRPPEPTDVGL